MFEIELFQKQIYCIEESACDIWTFRQPSSDSAPEELPRYAPDMQYYYILMSCFF